MVWQPYLPIGTEIALLYSLHRNDVVMQLASVGPVHVSEQVRPHAHDMDGVQLRQILDSDTVQKQRYWYPQRTISVVNFSIWCHRTHGGDCCWIHCFTTAVDMPQAKQSATVTADL